MCLYSHLIFTNLCTSRTYMKTTDENFHFLSLETESEYETRIFDISNCVNLTLINVVFVTFPIGM